ncbi:ATP-binding cassette domain-containing protein [Sandaracinus amylolyticus]|uniref:ATP-binding cassette domain-containing protein n=1 Tax=Sandaracinus amylolyticus TaxID=927083 RepID=UPI001F00F6A2|nr:ATP-binding cassette domain-containing protein [Sandaracinus amylolyticus]UJR78851.1 ATPase components of ABC transporter with duplicated ATPase domain [Sandaracinus amylolyticus]
MSLVVLESATVSFGARSIFEDLSLRVAEGDRIGLIGPNGSGKSTLLRVLSGEQQLDSGSLRRSRGVRVGWLPQDIVVEGGKRLLEFVRSSVPGRNEIEGELAAAEKDYEKALADQREGNDEVLLDAAARLADLHERIARFDALFSEHEAIKILAGLGFEQKDLQRDVGEFSGGWKMRAVLAALLFQQPDVMLLDEPTNHLDMPSVAWFSEFLQKYSRAFVLISHDREFLNEQARRIVTFEVEGVRQYPGNYEKYLELRAEEETILENKAKNIEREREKTEQFINRFRAQANKAKAVQSRIKALDKMESVETYRKRRAMSFTFPPVGRAGQDVVKIAGLRKAYGDHVVLPDVSLTVYRGDRIGIVGPNGAGKTTLLKMIAGELAPDRGTIELGHNVQPGYYAQHHAETLHPRSTVYDEVSGVNRELGQTRVRSVLGAFLFSGDDVDKPIQVLSGGERARVALARLMVKPGNFLLLDEPTNHLDLASCESLIESLESYDGTMLFVSHNRALVRRLANKIWLVEGGQVLEYPGNLDDYMALSRARISGEQTPEPVKSAPVKQSAPVVVQVPEAPRNREDDKARKREEARLREQRSKKIAPLKKKVDEILARIAELEAKQAERNQKLCDPAVAMPDAERFAMLTAMQTDAEKIEELTGRWEHAQEELEAAEKELGAG